MQLWIQSSNTGIQSSNTAIQLYVVRTELHVLANEGRWGWEGLQSLLEAQEVISAHKPMYLKFDRTDAPDGFLQGSEAVPWVNPWICVMKAAGRDLAVHELGLACFVGNIFNISKRTQFSNLEDGFSNMQQ